MKVFNYINLIFLVGMLLLQNSSFAQDDLYFDPNTDEYFEAVETDNYGDYAEEEYVDESYDDGDYYYDDDFYYSRRIRRFNRGFSGNNFGYYNPWFTNNYYIDPFYYSNRPGGVFFVTGPSFGYNPYANPYANPFNNPFANPYGYAGNPYGFYNPYSGYNPYGYGFNSYYDPCYNPNYNSYYGNGGGFFGNDYVYEKPTNFGPRRGAGGVVDSQGNGRASNIKEGRGGSNQPDRSVEDTGRTQSETSEPSQSTRPTRSTRTDRPSRTDRPTRNPRSETRSTPRSSSPRSTPRSSSSRSERSSRSSSGGGSSSRSSGSSSSKSGSSRSSKSPR